MKPCNRCNDEGMYEYNGKTGPCNYCLTGKLRSEN